MKELILIERPEQWEKAIGYAAQRIKEADEVSLLIHKDGVERCVRCEPQLFKILHQFILDGGKAYLCLKSLKERNIPPARPPEIFIRVDDGEELAKELKRKGFLLKEL